MHLWLIDLILSVGFKMQWTVDRCPQFIFNCSGISFALGIILWSITNFLLEFTQRVIALVFLGFLILDRQNEILDRQKAEMPEFELPVIHT